MSSLDHRTRSEIVAQVLAARENRPEFLERLQEALSSAIALNLHSFYTGVERILEALARFADGGIPTGEQWHRQLLEQMCLDIPEVRPAVISESTRTKLDEFRCFRHVVRSL